MYEVALMVYEGTSFHQSDLAFTEIQVLP